MKVKAYLEITMQIAPANRPAAAKVYQNYRATFLSNITGALSKELLVRDLDVQAYLTSDLFKNDVAPSLQPLWSAAPDVRIYTVA